MYIAWQFQGFHLAVNVLSTLLLTYSQISSLNRIMIQRRY